jgi:CheY-like chemotaxis protein
LGLLRGDPKPELIFLDMLVRQGMDGWNFMAIRRQVADLATLPIVITTGLDSDSDEWAAALDACDLPRKPLETDDLLDTLRKCL